MSTSNQIKIDKVGAKESDVKRIGDESTRKSKWKTAIGPWKKGRWPASSSGDAKIPEIVSVLFKKKNRSIT